MERTERTDRTDDLSVAVVAMSGRFPGARDLGQFWDNLRNGVESVRALTESELASSRVDPDLRRRTDYVGAGSFLDDVELFDAEFFGFSAHEAAVTDPQHRLFLECAWEALEAGGYASVPGRAVVGVFASCSTSSYLLNNLYTQDNVVPSVPGLQMLVGNDKDYLATHVSYKLNLTGPSLSVQSACSSSLVAVHLAVQSLLNRECDAALAGGVTVKVPYDTGYLHQDGLILSPDARTYSFDARGRGTVFGSGVGVVLLKRLSDAIAEGDTILAVIRGSAVNNDGATKMGFTAPSVDGQATVIAEALSVAGVGSETISYVEAHGTGTPLGDPIEIAALTKAFRASAARGQRPPRTGYCALGSVKTNVGHLESAAGIAGFIKTVLALSHGELPPSLHFERPNPDIDFPSTPFFVNRERRTWSREAGPRRAGVSSFGFGGTNCHVVLEEAPGFSSAAAAAGLPAEIPLQLTISARTSAALHALAGRYRNALGDLSRTSTLADVCYTAGRRRATFEQRVSVSGRTFAEIEMGLDRFLAGGNASESESAAVPVRGRCVALPPYPFERKRHWREPAVLSPAGDSRKPAGVDAPFHPLLQRLVEIADEADHRYWESRLGDPTLSFLVDHVVGGQAVFPASGYVEAALAAGRVAFGQSCRGLEEISFRRRLPIDGSTRMQVRVDARDGGFRIHARSEASAWTLHAAGMVSRAIATPGKDAGAGSTRRVPALAIDEIASRCSETIDPTAFYGALAKRGIAYGPAFRGIVEIRRGSGEALAHVRLPEPANPADYVFHPALLDGCFQAIAAAATGVDADGRLFVPSGIRGLDVVSPSAVPVRDAWIHAVLLAGGDSSEEIACALKIANETGVVLLTVDSLAARAVSVPAGSKAPNREAELGRRRYELDWERLALEGGPREIAGTRWLVAGDGDAAEDLARRLREAGADCEAVADPSRLADALVLPRFGVVYFAASYGDPAADFCAGCGDALAILHAPSRSGVGMPEIWFVTRGARGVASGGDVRAPGNAGLSGLARVIRLEEPNRRCAVVDLEHDPRPEDGRRIFDEIVSSGSEEQIAFRAKERFVARLVRERAGDALPPLASLRADASYLITGGLGALGLRIASWMAERGARHIVLAGRTAAESPETRDLGAASGCRILVRAADVGDEAQVRDLLREIGSDLPPLRGIVHAAGVLDDGLLSDQTAIRFENVMRPKVAGTWNLHRATEGAALDFFVTFSSAAAVLGSPGQANYAAANAAMDAIAHHRRGLGLPATSINWGPWAGVGMAASAGAAAHRRWRSRGITPLPIERGLDLLGAAIGDSRAQTLVLDADWAAALAPFAGSTAVPPLLSRLEDEDENENGSGPKTRKAAAASAADPSFLRELAACPTVRARRRALESRLRSEAAKLLDMPPADLDSHRPLNDLGLDSLMAIELRSTLSRTLGRPLSATLLFDYPTIDALARHLSGDEGTGEPAPPSREDSSPNSDLAAAGSAPAASHIRELSEEDAEALLRERLGAMGR